MRVLITGAAGNLGSFLTRHLLPSKHDLHLLIHQKELPFSTKEHAHVHVYEGDLEDPLSLYPACKDVDCLVHFAGVLFAPFPEKFLPTTNVQYVKNLLAIAVESKAKKFILISFPHVEGESTPDNPALGSLESKPNSIHARTRLEAEKHLFENTSGTGVTPVVLRTGMIYGRGVLMIEAARWLLARRMLGVWRESTWIHLLSLPDFLACTTAAIEGEHISGIYNLGDEKPMLLQEFLDAFAQHCGYAKPWRAPRWLFPLAGGFMELGVWLLKKPAPLTRDFIRIGMVSYTANTDRMRKELLLELVYPNLATGVELL